MKKKRWTGSLSFAGEELWTIVMKSKKYRRSFAADFYFGTTGER
jgi:hypothetical protein